MKVYSTYYYEAYVFFQASICIHKCSLQKFVDFAPLESVSKGVIDDAAQRLVPLVKVTKGASMFGL